MNHAPATIFALSSGHGRAGIAVIRISGPAAGEVLDRMAAPRPNPRQAALRRIVHPTTGDLLDVALVLYFQGPRSETGEDSAELHLHGSPAVVRAVLRSLSEIQGCRLAEPGEFARRAFENGRLDLTAAEGLADLIDAETDAQRRQALAQAGGAFARRCDGWRDRLLEARALAEAAIDFSDEADVATDALTRARDIIDALRPEIAAAISGVHRGEIVRDGFQVVLAGAPNAGKSSLLNILARRDVAIVSPEPGTTRDILEVTLDLGGYAVVLADTAGLRDAAGAIEREGMRRAVARAEQADLVIWLVDGMSPEWQPPPSLAVDRTRILTVLNKSDLARPPASTTMPPPLAISVRTGDGLAALLAELSARVEAAVGGAAGGLATLERHRAALADCGDALRRFEAATDRMPELAAEDLRIAVDALGRITGRVDAETVLGLIFGRFCIGK